SKQYKPKTGCSKKRDHHDRDVRAATKKIWHYHKQNTLLSSQTTPAHRSTDTNQAPTSQGVYPSPPLSRQLHQRSSSFLGFKTGILARDRKSPRLNSSHDWISYAVLRLK